MGLPPAILELENRSVGPEGEPTLGKALELAVLEWRAGNRDRELRLHLLFLAWYCNVEPPFITGFAEWLTASNSLPGVCEQVYATLADGIMDDPECLYVIGLMAQIAPWALGDEAAWHSRSENFRRRYRALLPHGLDPALFAGRGAYGEYFGNQACAKGGF